MTGPEDPIDPQEGTDEPIVAWRTFDEWYAQSWTGLVRVAMVDGASQAEAEDLAMDACVKLFGRWDGDRPERPTAWAFAVLKNAMRKGLHRRRRLIPVDEATTAPAWDGSFDVDLIEAIKALPERQREAIALRYVADLSQDEVALVMGVARGTASALLVHGRDNLRKALQR